MCSRHTGMLIVSSHARLRNIDRASTSQDTTLRPNFESVSRDLQGAARTMGLPIHVVHASTEGELETAFETLSHLRARAVIIGTDTFDNSQSKKLAALALRHSLLAIYKYREFVASGALMSYAGSITDAYRMAGTYTARILKGEKTSDLPVQQSHAGERPCAGPQRRFPEAPASQAPSSGACGPLRLGR